MKKKTVFWIVVIVVVVIDRITKELAGRIPAEGITLIPGVVDTAENLAAIEKIVGDSPWEKLPYNKLAPAKYKCVGRVWSMS